MSAGFFVNYYPLVIFSYYGAGQHADGFAQHAQ